MKRISPCSTLSGVLALIVMLFCGCASVKTHDKEALLSQAGFQIRTPSTPGQLAMYNKMTPYKLEHSTTHGRGFYSYADPGQGVVYIGGESAYQRYRSLARLHAMEEKETEASYSQYVKTIDQEWGLHL